MKPSLVIRSGITASAVAHLAVLMLVLYFADVHPFASVTAEPITVDIVTPAEAPPVAKLEQPEPKPSDSFELPAATPSPNSAPPAAQPLAAQPPAAQSPAAQPAPARPQQQKKQQAALSSPPPAPQPSAAQQPPATSATAASKPPAPDPSTRYRTMVGWPPPDILVNELGEKPGDAGDAGTTMKADIASSAGRAFRSHLKTCSKLPASVSPLDGIQVRVRVFMTREGRLAADPAPMEGPASRKGIDLTQSAIEALKACEPYPMLPADKYSEWKVMDLRFTPQDFIGG